MSANDRLLRVEASLRHGKECHEGVTRKGEFQPCDKPAIALRDSREDDAYYPVCAYHARGFCIPLVDPDDAAALVAALRAVLEVHAPDPYCGNWHHNPHRCPCAIPACADGCDTYPCPTVRAIEEALNA